MRAQWQGMVCNTTKIWSSYYHPRKTGGNCYQTACYWVPLFGIQALACMLVQDGHLPYIGWVIYSPIEDPNHCNLFLMLILLVPYLFYVGFSYENMEATKQTKNFLAMSNMQCDYLLLKIIKIDVTCYSFSSKYQKYPLILLQKDSKKTGPQLALWNISRYESTSVIQ